MIRSAWERLHWPQVVVLLGFLASVVAALIWTPPVLIEKAAAADWRAIGAVVVAILTALGGIAGKPLLSPRDDRPPRRWDDDLDDDPTAPHGPRALERRDRPPGDRPARRREGAVEVDLVYALFAAALLVAIAALALSGCGGSAIQTQADAVRLAAIATEGAARVVEHVAATDAERSCPDTPDDDVDRACVARLRAVWAPADVALEAVRAALLVWWSAVELARSVGDGADPWGPAVRGGAALLARWADWSRALAPLGVALPELPPLVLTAATALEGAR